MPNHFLILEVLLTVLWTKPLKQGGLIRRVSAGPHLLKEDTA